MENEATTAKETGRLEAFSDGVFAIAITLLVLNLKVPAFESLLPGVGLEGYLISQWPVFLAYLIGFATILIAWIYHHQLFSLIRRVDNAFLFMNGALLLFISFVPFPTSLLAEHIEHDYAYIAMAIYAGNAVVITLLFNLLLHYAAKGNRLLAKNCGPGTVESLSRQYALGPPIYFLSFVLAFFSVAASLLLCFMLTIFFALASVYGKNLFGRNSG